MTRAPILLVAVLCMAIAATPAHAQSQVLAGWGESPSNGAPIQIPFDCSSNAGSHSIVYSVVLPYDAPGVNGFTLDISVVGGPPGSCENPGGCVLPNLQVYWDLSATGCRAGTISAQAGFPDDPGTSSVDNGAFGGALVVVTPYEMKVGSSGYYGNPVPYTYGHYVVQGALPAGQTVDLVAGREYYVATVTIRNSKTTLCEGCCEPANFYGAVSLGAAGNTVYRLNGMPAIWQNYASNLCTPVPVRTSSWGALKSAYR